MQEKKKRRRRREDQGRGNSIGQVAKGMGISGELMDGCMMTRFGAGRAGYSDND